VSKLEKSPSERFHFQKLEFEKIKRITEEDELPTSREELKVEYLDSQGNDKELSPINIPHYERTSDPDTR